MNIPLLIASLVAIFSTAMVITRFNAVHALLYLIVSFFAVAVAFYSMGAPFIAALEVIIYAGAIMVLFIFVVMLLNLGPSADSQRALLRRPAVWLGPAMLSAVLLIELIAVVARRGELGGNVQAVAPSQVSASLFSTYMLAVEMASMLLLAGLVGAFYLGRRTDQETRNVDAPGAEKEK
jgi:NADH-quinone oxidoreductase subunit J